MAFSADGVFYRALGSAVTACMATGGARADEVLRTLVRSSRRPDEKAARVVCFLGIVRHWRLLRALDGAPVAWDGQEFPRIWAAWTWWTQGRDYPKDFEVPKGMSQARMVAHWAAAHASRAVRLSVPDWLDQRAAAALGEERWTAMAEAMLEQAFPHLRVNRRKINAPDLFRRFDQAGLWPVWVDEARGIMAIRKPAELFETQEFQHGLFEQQDAASQSVAPFLDPQPGQRVADVCCGEGGKTLHLSELMRGKGRILALDPSKHRLETLRKRAARADAQNIEVKNSSEAVWTRLHGQFDRVLIDAPCSGLGTLRRHPDIKWRLQPADVERLAQLQATLLAQHVRLAKVGGFVVFATCSVLPEEGEDQVRAFLETHAAGYELVAEHRSDPATANNDGFYAAKLLRKA